MKKFRNLPGVFLLIIALLIAGQGKAEAAEIVDLTEYAKKFVGVPYKWGGTTPSGFDCSGYVSYVYSEFGVELPRTSADQFGQGDKIEPDDRVPGDLLFFTTYKPGPSHSGIYLGENKFIHASPKGIEIASLNDSYYKKRYLGARRYIQTVLIKEGQIGTVYIKKKVNLWQRDENGKLKEVRVLNPGESYRVYGSDNLYGGQFNLGSQMYITNIETHIEFKPASIK
ncbi:C40 family peptidase [Bacillus sp. FJAT-27445]|uniref:C40 family peptidase n=1 Tax=Bacillus sp. FJAT-27445 TaxID=1679166 RepID=UPI000743ADDB|nr:C40 family peptidase [Bacillus sp. FJAT-27445]